MAEGNRTGFRTRRAAERLSVGPALGMSLMDSFGITDIIDKTCGFHGESALSPGNAVKAICGTMFTDNKRKALYNVEGFYSYAPVSRLFGPEVEHSSLNDSTLGRCLDRVFESGTTEMFNDISNHVHTSLRLDSRFLHLDTSNVTVFKNPKMEQDEYGPKAAHGHAKDGHDERLQYSFESIVDEHGLQLYMKAHDGNADDGRMAMEALRFMESRLNNQKVCLVADCKIVYEDMVNRLIWNNYPFVSKCPENFGDNARRRVLDIVRDRDFTYIGRIGKRKDSPEFEVCDLDLKANDETLRFLAYRIVGGSDERSMDYYRNHCGKKVTTTLKRLMKQDFACKDDASSATDKVLKELSVYPFRISYGIVEKVIREKRTSRGRPRKDEPPPKEIDRYRIEATWELDEDLAEIMAEDHSIRVLVTTLPRAEPEDGDETRDPKDGDPFEGATMRDVMRIYLGQWRVESIFGEYKSNIGADTVFLQTNRRVEVLLFMVAIAAMIRSVIKLLLGRNRTRGSPVPNGVTAKRFFFLTSNMFIEIDRSDGMIVLDGSDDDCIMLEEACAALYLDPSKLLG